MAAARTAALPVSPLPGASSITAALSVAGIVQDGGFFFSGFLPAKSTERDAAVQALAAQPRAVVLLEAPHRIEALAQALSRLGERGVTIGRELTKQFEEIATVAAQDLPRWLSAQPHRARGEFVLVLHPAAASEQAPETGLQVLRLLMQELPVKTAVRLAAEITGEARNALYEAALRIKNEA